uniref:Uncharacterized protein n=1 Tax=Anguilla anguilla TaxID=7936 RepID=A0A0E9QBJ7_ANGAN
MTDLVEHLNINVLGIIFIQSKVNFLQKVEWSVDFLSAYVEGEVVTYSSTR